jgi:hypothetical protein
MIVMNSDAANSMIVPDPGSAIPRAEKKNGIMNVSAIIKTIGPSLNKIERREKEKE